MIKIIWTSSDAEKATNGKSTKGWQASGVSIDSRSINEGDLFFALIGDDYPASGFNGHDYIIAAYEAGASAAVVSIIPDNIPEDFPILIVDNTYDALVDMAKYRRRNSDAKVIAITGSVGKTSVKNFLGHALSKQGKTHITEGNLNNHIGMPLTLCRMPQDCQYGVFELGMNHAGEIKLLSEILKPDIAVITAVEEVHMQFFDSIDDIARAKAEIFVGVDKNGYAILPHDSPQFSILKKAASRVGNIVTFGEGEGTDYKLISISDNIIKASISGNILEYKLPIVGRHQAVNSLAVLAAIDSVGADIAKAVKSFEELTPQKGRGSSHQLILNDKNIAIIDDSYNASPASMRAAFAVLGSYSGRKIALLGDMLELGDDEVKYHSELAKDIVASDIDLVITSGERVRYLYDNLPTEKRLSSCNNIDEVISVLLDNIKEGDIVLIKGSHGSNMWKIAEQLIARGEA